MPVTIKASDLCALNLADPVLPSVPTIAAAFFKDPASITQVWNYVRDKLRYSAFTNACVCNPNPSGTCNTQQLAASGWTNGGGASGRESEGFRFTAVGTSCAGGWLYTGTGVGWTAQNVGLWSVTGATKIIQQAVSTPGGANSVAHFSWSGGPITLVPGQDYIITIDKENLNAYAFRTHASPSVAGKYTAVSQVYSTSWSTMPATASGAEIGCEPEICGPDSATTPVSPTIPTQPTGLNLPPAWSCSTTADLCLRLQQISQKIDWLMRQAPLVTSSSVAESTVHSGLTGTGTIAVSGIRGLRAELTTVPSYYGGSGTNPTARYGLGRLDLEDPEGWFDRRQLTESPLRIDVTNPYISTVGYTLNAGVVLKLTELVQGP